MELIALKKLSNGVKSGQTFHEQGKTAELLIAIGAAREVRPGVFVAEQSTSIFAPPRRRGRSRRSVSTEPAAE